MKVSLIIPAYNEENYIAKLLDSILVLTTKPNEIIVCDNNSTDQTVTIVKKYIPKLPIKIVSETKKGIIPAVEKAWRSATGDLILRTDADCVLPKDWVSKHLLQYQSDPLLSACGGGYYATDGNNFIKTLTPALSYLNHLVLHLARGYRVLYGGNMSIKRSALIKINGYQGDNYGLQEDVFLSKKLAESGLKYYYLTAIKNSTSLRRFNNLNNIYKCFMSGFIPRLYQEKN